MRSTSHRDRAIAVETLEVDLPGFQHLLAGLWTRA